MAPLIATWHTDGRRQPAVLGKDSSGKKLPGGPYTGPQVAAATIVGLSLMLSRPYWAWIVQSRVVFEWGLIAGLTFAAMKLATRLDYTNLSVLWRIYGGLRAGLLGLWAKGPISSATGQPLDYSGGRTWASACQVVAFREVGDPEADPPGVTATLEVPWAGQGRRPLDQLVTSPAAQTQPLAERPGRERQFVSVGRRQPRVPVALAAPAAVAERPPSCTVSEPELVTAAPRGALQEFLAAAGRLPGESR